MTSKYTKADISSQSKFCTELLLRLNDDIKKAEMDPYCGINGHSRMRDDIRRIRRELMTLSNMLDPWRA